MHATDTMADFAIAPLGVSTSSADTMSDDAWQRRCEQIAWVLVIVGITARLVRYLLRFPLWGDEHMLAESLILRDYGELMQPLSYVQIAPLLYLWLERAALDVFGVSEWSLRLVALVSGIASVLLFRHLAGRLLRGVPMVLAVGFFSVAYYPVRHSAEVKAYASDALVALVLMTLAVEWYRSPQRTRWLWILAAVTPLCVGLSYPAVFVGGGISLGLLARVWKLHDRRTWLAFVACQVALVGSFGLLYWFYGSTQMSVTGPRMQAMWEYTFPPSLLQPLEWGRWLLAAHTGEMYAYPIGADRGGSTLTFIAWLVAAVVMYRSRHRPFVLMCLGMFALALVAATLRKYPYAANERMVHYTAPSICLLAGLGTATLLAKLKQGQMLRPAAMVIAIGLCVFGTGMVVRDIVHPYKFRYGWEHQGFARWFWGQDSSAEDLVCVYRDQGKDFYQPLGTDISVYRVYRDIYSRPGRTDWTMPKEGDPLPTRPVRCVVYAIEPDPPKQEQFATWFAEMEKYYTFKGRDSHRIKSVGGTENTYCRYHVFHFEPKAEATVRVPSQSETPEFPDVQFLTR